MTPKSPTAPQEMQTVFHGTYTDEQRHFVGLGLLAVVFVPLDGYVIIARPAWHWIEVMN